MSSSPVNKYIGYNELVDYLNNHKNKSFRGFLFRYRDVIVTSSISFPITCWQDLDNSWARKFLKEAEELDRSSFDVLNKKVRSLLFTKERVTSS